MSLPNSSDPVGPPPESPGLPPPPPPPAPEYPYVLESDPAFEQPTEEEEAPTLARPRLRRPAEPLPETSFADRYRGTEWQPGTEQPPEPAATPAQKWRPSSRQLLWAGAALLAIAALAGVVLYAGATPRTGMGGFTGMTPAPTTASTPAPTAPPQVTPSPSLEPPWVTDPRHPAGLFEELMTSSGLAFRLDVAMTLDGSGETARVSHTADVDGPDYSWTQTVTTDTKSVEVAAVRKGPFYYTKLDTQPWVRRGAQPAYGVLGNLDAAAWAQMQYVGPESAGNQLMHHLRAAVSGWPGPADSMVFQVVAAPPTYWLDVWVDDRGRPERASFDAQLTLRVNGGDAPVGVHADYTFSRWGKHPRIEAPDHFNPG
jgi:hypothetical protein